MAEERKVATMLFADLVGSTELARDQDPERTRARLDRFYVAMAAEIEQAGGTIEKFAGDAVMAVFGAPTAQEDHAERALHAALSMQRRLRVLFDDALSMRIGVNTGEVVVGQAREQSSFVSGAAVNAAARLEQAAGANEILVGERTVAAVRGAFEFSAAVVVEAKGVAGGLGARRLIRSLSLMRPRGVGGLGQAFVGRDDELGRLIAAYRDVAEQGRPKLVTLLGDAGVGKTRLLRELWQRLDDETTPPLRRTGRCLAYGRGITYWPLGEILREHFTLMENDAPAEILARLAPNEILAVTLGLDAAPDLHPLAARDQLHEAWISLLESLTGDQPVVVLIEDVHWAEAPLLDLLARLGRDVAGPLLLVATARPEFLDRGAGWGGGRIDAETIWLEPLRAARAAELVDRLLTQRLPDDFRSRVVEQSEGNPFFVEEVLGALIDRGVLAPSSGGWQVNAMAEGFSLPDSVQAVIASRIDLLPEAEKTALQAAAVIGRTFWTGPIYRLLEGSEPDLRILEDRDFIRRRAGTTLAGEVEYAFKHALTREVAYGGLPKAARARLHAEFAEWLEVSAGDEAAAILAHHYARAADPDDADLAWADDAERLSDLRRRAATWLGRAGTLALSRYELDDAVALLSRALEFDPDDDAQVDLYEALGRAHELRFDGEAFWDAIENALARCTDRARRAELYTLLVCGTAGRAGMWKRLPAGDVVAAWVAKACELADPHSAPYLRALIGGYWFDVVDDATAEAAADEILASSLGPLYQEQALDTKKVLAFKREQYAQALETAAEEIRVADESGDPELYANAREGSVGAFMLCCRFADAKRLVDEFQRTAQRLSAHHRLHGVAMALELDEVMGDWEHILTLVPETRRAIDENRETPCVRDARSLLLCAAAAASLGDAEQANNLETEGEAHAADLRGHDDILLAPRLRLAYVRGDRDRIAELANSPLARRRQIWFFPGAAATYLDALPLLADVERVKRDAAKLGKPGTVLEAFAARAVAVATGDGAGLDEAARRFDELNLPRRAAETRTLAARPAG